MKEKSEFFNLELTLLGQVRASHFRVDIWKERNERLVKCQVSNSSIKVYVVW